MNRQLPDRLRLDRMATPIGEALIVTDEEGYLRAFDWADCEASMARLLRRHYGSLTPSPGAAPKDMKRLQSRYFDGEIACLDPIERRTSGTPFQPQAWTGRTRRPPGERPRPGARGAAARRTRTIPPTVRAHG